MTKTKRVLQLLIVLIVFPLVAAIVGTANAKGRTPHNNEPAKAQVVRQCMKDIGTDADRSSLALNQVCTCLVDKMGPSKNELNTYLKGRQGRKELGRCLSLATDGL